jgi:sensor c-di-GMP phosphodiesterase-like protein
MSEDHQEEQIDKELIKQSLYNLGKTFNNARHAYLSLNLSNNSLTTINVSTPLKLNFMDRDYNSTFTSK